MFSTHPHRILLLAMILVTGGATGAVTVGAAAADDPSGVWKVQLSIGNRGSRTSILKLQRQGDALTGTLMRFEGSQTAIENGRYLDGELSFDLSRDWNGRKFSTRYVGTLVKDTIQGTTQFAFRGRQRTWDWVATRTTSEPTTQAASAPPVAADIDLNAENYQAWHDHILPKSSELAWEQIPWLTTFQDGILAADAADKPLLLWTMNGHPLGCT